MSSTAVTDISIEAARPGPTWRIAPGQTLRWREWHSEYVLYNDLSGDTHLLDASAIELLHTLQDGPADAAALAAVLAGDDGLSDPAAMAALLAHLQALALIDPLA